MNDYLKVVSLNKYLYSGTDFTANSCLSKVRLGTDTVFEPVMLRQLCESNVIVEAVMVQVRALTGSCDLIK